MALKNLTETSSKGTYSLLEYEEMFFGALTGGVIDSEEIQRVKSDYFTKDETKKLYDICNHLFIEDGWIDFVKVLSELGELLGTTNAKSYLDRIVSSVPLEFSVSSTAIELENAFLKRVSNKMLDEAKIAIHNSPSIAPEIIYATYEKIEALHSHKVDFSIKEEFSDTVDNLISETPDRSIIKTGIKAIDKLIGGLSTQEVTIFGGRPGHGKTTISIGLAYNILKTNPKAKVVKFELEMSKEAVKRKFLSLESRVSSYKMRLGALTEDEKKKISEAGQRFGEFEGRLFIFDNVYGLPEMMKICKGVKADVCMVDFITLMDGVDEDKRNDLGKVVKYAKRFAKAHNMSWIFFSQLNRGQEIRESHRPMMSDLAESDQLTQLASEIVLLFYRFKYSFEENDSKKLHLIFDKTRYSAVGDTKIFFNPDLCMIGDL